MDPLTRAVDLIREEQEHARDKGYTVAHDVQHSDGSIGVAAQGYLDHAIGEVSGYSVDSPPWNWPWDEGYWKPRDSALENLILAASMIASEIDRIMYVNLNPEEPQA